MQTPLILGLVGLACVALLVRYAFSTEDRSPLAAALDARLEEALGPKTGSHLDRAPRVRRLDVVEERAEEPVYALCVRVDLGTTDAPGTKLVFEFVASVLEAVHPVFENWDGGVAYYDVEFTFGPNGLFVDGECARVTVPAELADEFVEDERYRAFDLRRDVERADRTESVATSWGACRPK
jgi:hypothetical protein